MLSKLIQARTVPEGEPAAPGQIFRQPRTLRINGVGKYCHILDIELAIQAGLDIGDSFPATLDVLGNILNFNPPAFAPVETQRQEKKA